MHQIHLFCSGAATSRQARVVDETDGSHWGRSWYWCRQGVFYWLLIVFNRLLIQKLMLTFASVQAKKLFWSTRTIPPTRWRTSWTTCWSPRLIQTTTLMKRTGMRRWRWTYYLENWPYFSPNFCFVSQASKLDSDSDIEIVNGDEEMESEEDDWDHSWICSPPFFCLPFEGSFNQLKYQELDW